MTTPFQCDAVRRDFPILQQNVNGKPLVYLDNAATTQKPQAVIDALVHYYQYDNANVHRGAHALADRATRQFEAARQTVQRFINAGEDAEILWTKGTTESINIVAHSFLPTVTKKGDKVIVSALEHHANFVPWQQQCLRLGLEFVVIPITPAGEFDMSAFEAQLDERVAMVAVAQVANSFGSVHPVQEIIDKAHAVGAKVLIDGAQAVSHFAVDVQALDCDFYAFSGHKLFAPTGIGVLYGKRQWLEQMQVYQLGGEMIADVSIERTTFNVLPYKFEAGTPNIADVIGLKAAIDYFQSLDSAGRQAHEQHLMDCLSEKARAMTGLTPLAIDAERAGVLSFVLDGIHCHDVAMLLDKQGIAIRTGHHCAMPIMKQFALSAGTLRASVSFYNTEDDIERLFEALAKAQQFLA
ncbi:MAG: cysteine desulfurase CsdA [Gammaproteobacteria bacterium]|nr:MAG: cysteine desulfurase CsdA [Gammaproteobacteria bacterium]